MAIAYHSWAVQPASYTYTHIHTTERGRSSWRQFFCFLSCRLLLKIFYLFLSFLSRFQLSFDCFAFYSIQCLFFFLLVVILFGWDCFILFPSNDVSLPYFKPCCCCCCWVQESLVTVLPMRTVQHVALWANSVSAGVAPGVLHARRIIVTRRDFIQYCLCVPRYIPAPSFFGSRGNNLTL